MPVPQSHSLVPHGLHAKLLVVSHLLVGFTPREARGVGHLRAVEAQVDVTLLVHPDTDLLGACGARTGADRAGRGPAACGGGRGQLPAQGGSWVSRRAARASLCFESSRFCPVPFPRPGPLRRTLGAADPGHEPPTAFGGPGSGSHDHATLPRVAPVSPLSLLGGCLSRFDQGGHVVPPRPGTSPPLGEDRDAGEQGSGAARTIRHPARPPPAPSDAPPPVLRLPSAPSCAPRHGHLDGLPSLATERITNAL